MYVGFDVPNSTLPDDHAYGEITIDPRDGHVLPRDQLALGSAFFYPMHFSLHITWYDIGYWIVALAAMAMLAAIVSGVVMHRKIFREFFTFRPGKKLLRSTLDLHNLTGVVALPFHFLWALSGLIIFAGIYFPVLDKMMQPLVEAHEREEATHTGLDTHPSGKPGTLASVDAMVAAAKERWASRGVPGEVGFLFVNHVGNSNASVSIYRDSTDRVATAEGLHFEGSTGRVIFEDPPTGPIETVNGFLTGMHLQQFRHWTLRWLIFVGGLLSSVCIATGFIFFVEKRKHAHASAGSRRFALGGCAGRDHRDRHGRRHLVCAGDESRAAGRPGASRYLGKELVLAGVAADARACDRGVPLRCSRRACRRPGPSRAGLIALLGVLAVVLNAVTTGDHLGRTLMAGYWPVAGVDLMLLACAFVAGSPRASFDSAPATPSPVPATLEEPEHA